jgi:hypothetical protein
VFCSIPGAGVSAVIKPDSCRLHERGDGRWLRFQENEVRGDKLRRLPRYSRASRARAAKPRDLWELPVQPLLHGWRVILPIVVGVLD